MAWSDAARAAALEARRMHAKDPYAIQHGRVQTVKALRAHYFKKRNQDAGRYAVQVGKTVVQGTPRHMRQTLFKISKENTVGMVVRPRKK